MMLVAERGSAHFKLNLNIRIVHAEHVVNENSAGMRVYMRLPLPYLLAPMLGEEQADGSRAPAPYTTNTVIDGELMHRVDADAILADPDGLGQLVVDAHHWKQDDAELAATLLEVRVHAGDQQPPFSTLQEAKRAFTAPQSMLADAPFVGDSVIDVLLLIDSDKPITRYFFSSSMVPGLDGQEDTANLILDHYGDDVLIFRETGLLTDAIKISRSALQASATFLVEGVKHILGGFDHVLFVICLVLGALSIGALVWRVTGFTLGHTVTLTSGFFGFVPDGSWFIPAVELGIAISIILAAVAALSGSRTQQNNRLMFIVTVALGLLHGLGFSFVLHDILNVSSPNLWQSLLAFNIGVELGQLMIVAILWPLLWWAAKTNTAYASRLRWLLALPCLILASIWSGERVMLLLNELPVTI